MKLISKRIACLLLAVVMAVGLFPASAFAARLKEDVAVAEPPAGEDAVSAGLAERPADPLEANAPAQLAAEGDLTIPGYTQVTAMPTDGLSGKYLIVATYNGNYYMLYPGAIGAGANVKNSAKLVVNESGTATGYKVNVPSYDDTETATDFSLAENTITKNGERYSVTAGTNYKLCLLSGSAGYRTEGESALQITVSNGLFRFTKPENSNANLLFFSSHMNFNQAGGINAAYFPDMMLFQKDPPLPGYNQVTNLNQINRLTDKTKFLVVAEGETGLYALYPRLSPNVTAGGLPTPAGTYGLRCARLTVNGQTVTAAAAASHGAATLDTSITDISSLHLTITPGTGSTYQFISTATPTVKFNLGGNGMFASDAGNLTVTITGGELSVFNSSASRYLSFSESGSTHYNWTGCGSDFWGPTAKTGAPLYLFYQGELPNEPGMALAGMLSGDQIGDANTESPNNDPSGQNSWVFTGGRAAQGSFADVAGARTWAGHFEEWVRYTHAKQLQPSGEATTPYLQRHVINTAYEDQTLAQIVSGFDTRIAALKPRAVVYLVEENGRSEADFNTNLNSLIAKALALRGGTGMIVIETLTAEDKAAVDTVVNALSEDQQPRVLPVLSTLTTEQKTGGYPNAQGHLQLAKALADAVAGTTVSTASGWPYGAIAAGTFATGWPEKAAVTGNHEDYGTPEAPTTPQQTIKTKVDGNDAMTWLFMGDSITHGAAWTGGYDSLAQLFEKFVKDDLDRKQDIVINAGSSGANTASTITDLDRRLSKYSPDVVVLMLGTNSSGINDDQYKTNLHTILDKIIAKGAVPVLRTPPPSANSGYTTRLETRSQLIRDVAAEETYADKVIVVDQHATWNRSNYTAVFTRDTSNVHPDEAGHLWFAHQLINDMGLWKADAEICQLEYVAREATVSPDNLTIDGYTKVTELPEDGLEPGYYLFVAPYNGNFYMLYPGATGGGANANNAAKLVVNTGTGKATGYRTKANGYDSGTLEANFTKADNLVALSSNTATYENNPAYSVTARTGNYVLFAGTGVAYSASGDSVTFFVRNSDGSLTLRNNASNHGALHFLPTNMNFNQSGGNPDNRSFLLFKSETLPPVPLDQLRALIATAEAKTQSDYTAASWAGLAAPLAAAKTVAEDSSQNTQYTPVANALKALQAAVNALQEKPHYQEVPTTAQVVEPKPADGATAGQPFISENGGIAEGTYYRIPSIVTVKGHSNTAVNGRVVAAVDARWRDFRDSSNIDTLVSYSDDNGETWHYSFVNYFGDSSNTATNNKTAIFIDPILTADNSGNLFLLTNAFPAGTCTHMSRDQDLARSTGFVNVTLHDGTQVPGQRMAIYTNFVTNTQTDTNYSYYLGDFNEAGYADILEAYDGLESGYYADRHFNLYYKKGLEKAPATDKIYCAQLDNANAWVHQNLFYQNAVLHVRTTEFMWMVKSTDGGTTWGDPIILNPGLRIQNEGFFGPGPGAGICLDDGTIIMPTYTDSVTKAACIYSTDGGETWTRGATLSTGTESCIVPIDATTVRQFYRDNTTTIHYIDRIKNSAGEWVPGSEQDAPNAPKQGNNQLFALRYSKQVNGKDIILVSTATSPGTAAGYQRKGGKIYAFELKSDKTMELVSTYTVNNTDNWFGYSSMTELPNGDIGLIYENSQTDGNDPVMNALPAEERYCGMTYRAIPMHEIIESQSQTVSLTPTTATLYTNAGAGATTVQLNATVTPAGPTIVWTSSAPTVATVSNTGLVTAVGDGTATITATSSSDETAFATCTVTVTTKIERITVKKDGVAIGSNQPVIVYTNATDEDHSVTLTAETVPANVTHPVLNWTRPEGAKGQLTLSSRGENGSNITITAVPGERNVGEVTVEVASAEHPEIKTTFKVHVIRKLESNASISIRGVNDPTKAPQVGQTLEADINNLQMTDAGKDALTYQWKRTKNGVTTGIAGQTAKTYVLTTDDVDAILSVDVTAGADSFYEGTRPATRNQPVELADGPLTGPQGLTGTAPSGADAADGTITGFGSDWANYEYRLMVTGGVENEWIDVPGQTISSLAAGTYQVRAKETETHKAGGFSVVTVPPAGVTTYAIALDAMTNGRVSRSDSVAAESATVTLTVLPETGYRLASNGLSVATANGSSVPVTRVAGQDNEYTFAMPGEAVTVSATFEQRMFTITHELTNLHCSLGAAEGHRVAYGEGTAVTLVPDEGYALPLRRDITVTNSTGVVVTGWTINDEGVITITGGVTSDLVIVAVGRPSTHTVNYTLTNGLNRLDAPDSVGHLAAYEGVLGTEDGYQLPETIIVTVGGSLIGAENYLYNKDTGEISISAGKIYDNVVITAVGVKVDDEVVPVTGVTLNRTQASVTVGGTLSLTATVLPANATTKDVVWSAEDTGIATVDENGTVTAVAEGSTTITVMTVNGRHTATCTVTVTKPSNFRPSTSTSNKTETREDGSKVTTVTKPDGSKTVTV
ncbi:MAG: Ig-like domain-containing protein, partial [Oscillospiraceae bacterium]